MDDNNNTLRLSKLMSQKGICSRREADQLISDGHVMVDGEVIKTLGTKVLPSAEVVILKRGQTVLSQKMTILIHKPVGYVSSQPEDGHQAAVELLNSESQLQSDTVKFRPYHLRGLAPAGRLDIDSKGLLILTQDGVIAKQLIGENSETEKEYLVWVLGAINDRVLDKLQEGLSLDGKKLKPAKVQQIAPGRLKFILKEGKKRQIRRMCEAVGLKVTSLKRIRIGQIKLGNLPEGSWRFLKENENF